MKAAPQPIALPATNRRELGLGMAGLLFLTLLVYIPSYKAGFIWDDDVIAGHPLFKKGWAGLYDLWFSIKYGDFCPVTATSFWVEWQVHGGMKEIQHATNIVLQALNVVLLWRVLAHLRIPGAWLAAAIFAVHPVSVASVTWLAERKNTLSLFFYLLSLLFYFRSEKSAQAKTTSHFRQVDYWLAFVCFLLGLLSKSSVVVLPVVILWCAWWRDGRLGRQNLWPVLPFFIFALAAGVTTLVAHFYFGPKLGVLPTGDGALVRWLTAGRAVWFYLGKDVWPVGLTLHYPRWVISPTAPLAYLPGLAVVGMLVLFWKFRQSWGRAGLFGFGYFLLAVAPTVGVVNMAFLMMAPVADHLQYLALPGIIALVAGGGLYLLQKWNPGAGRALPVVLTVVLVTPLAALSWRHQRIMAHPEALWLDNLEKNPISWTAHNNLGGIRFEQGKLEEATRLFALAVQYRTNLSMVRVNYGRSLFALGRTKEAVDQYVEALRLDATDFKAHNNLGVALLTVGRTNEAIACFQKAADLAPDDPTFFANLARLLQETGQLPPLIELYRRRVERVPTDGGAHQQLGELWFAAGNLKESRAHYQEAVRLRPASIEARFGLAEILARQNQTPAAVEQWRQILQMKPDAAPVLANLSWVLATHPDGNLRNGGEAVRLAEKACALVGKNAAHLHLLAAAYAEAGRFPEAVRTAEEAVRQAEADGQKALADQYRERLKLYQAGQPCRNL